MLGPQQKHRISGTRGPQIPRETYWGPLKSREPGIWNLGKNLVKNLVNPGKPQVKTW